MKTRKKPKFTRKKLKKFKRIYVNSIRRFQRRKRRKLRGFKLRNLKFLMKLRGPQGNARNVGKSCVIKLARKDKKRLRNRYLSSKIGINLFKITYETLLSYHSPLGKRDGEWKVNGVMLTNILLIRNQMSILDLTSIFFELRKMINHLFKTLKLRKGVALLNGRRYGWRKIFTFIFEKWLPGFFTNFRLNINEIVGYFIRRRFLTRRQKARAMSLKTMLMERNYLYSFRKKDKKRMKRESKLINYMKLPRLSLSLIDNVYWLRECRKVGIKSIQVIDSNSDIEKVDYPIISNQQSIAFLSFITLLAKEVAYQARFWEITRFKKLHNYYAINEKIKNDNLVKNVSVDLNRWNDKIVRYNRYLELGYKLNKGFADFSETKVSFRKSLIKLKQREEKKFGKIDEYINKWTYGYKERRNIAKKLLDK